MAIRHVFPVRHISDLLSLLGQKDGGVALQADVEDYSARLPALMATSEYTVTAIMR